MKTESSYLLTCRSTCKTQSWLTRVDLGIVCPSAFHNICFCHQYQHIWQVLYRNKAFSHSSSICSWKNKVPVSIYISFRMNKQKLICRTDLSYDPHIFVTQFGRRRCAWLGKNIFRANDHCFGLVRSVEYHHSA